MPTYQFCCRKCGVTYEDLANYDATGKYAGVECPDCGSKRKKKLPTVCRFDFAQPEGTDRWNSEQTGHDYRFKSKIPQVKKEREMAEALSHMGADPYGDTSAADIDLDVGVHDPELRPGLS